ncbi:hypothetical protein [Bacillus subtilis]|uniref:hypothetical protein n=1 Tax=Bacillus subtilis TaxID=1423 RepID=UPI0021D9734F|nr:hypothetical protein [Bacillus subtilis]
MNTQFSKEYIHEVAKSLFYASEHEVAEFEKLLKSHPHGEELDLLLSDEFALVAATEFAKEVFGDLFDIDVIRCESPSCACAATEEDRKQTSLLSLKDIIESQITAEKLSKEARNFVDPQDLSSIIRDQVNGQSLSSLIKGQLDNKKLADLIKEQLIDESSIFVGEKNDSTGHTDLKQLVIGILDSVVTDFIQAGFFEEELDLFTVNKLEDSFALVFTHKACEKQLGLIYKTDYTAYIVEQLAIYYVGKGYQLTFKNVDNIVVPTLKKAN